MQTTVEVAFVNQPKNPGWSGSIKTSDGQYYSVKESDLGLFQKGQKYTIGYDEVTKGGKTYRNFNGALLGPTTETKTAPATNGANHYSQTDTRERGMFIMGVVGRAMGSGKFEASDIEVLTKIAAASYDEVFSGS